MEMGVKGLTVLVTGGTSGVGECLAQFAAESGAAGLFISGRDEQRGAEVVSRLSALGCPTGFISADLEERGAPQRIAGAALAHMPRIDCLANVAAITDRAGLDDADEAIFDRIFAVNTRAPFFLMQHAVRDMRRRGAPGSIVNILSVNAHCGGPELAVYSGSKGALATLTRNAANALLPERIRVNGINMGWTATPAEHKMQAQTLGKGEDWEKAAAASMPLKRLMTPEEVARVALFLLSDASGLMTGALIDLDQRVQGAP